MSLHAYMLVETDSEPADFVRQARRIKGVAAAHALFGPLDAIVHIEADGLAEMEEIVGRVHGVPGLKSGDTRIARSV